MQGNYMPKENLQAVILAKIIEAMHEVLFSVGGAARSS